MPVTRSRMAQLFSGGVAADPIFNRLRAPQDRDDYLAREFVEGLWIRFQPHSDRHFTSQIRDHFGERFWEMYLTCALMEEAGQRGYSLRCPKPGPDILLEVNRKRIWIEAVMATADREIAEEKTILRYAQCILEKHRKYLGYLEKRPSRRTTHS